MSTGTVYYTHKTEKGFLVPSELLFAAPTRSRYESASDFKVRIDVVAKKSISRYARSRVIGKVNWKTDLGYRNY